MGLKKIDGAQALTHAIWLLQFGPGSEDRTPDDADFDAIKILKLARAAVLLEEQQASQGQLQKGKRKK